jgi:NitT/TauT family transport system permease protein
MRDAADADTLAPDVALVATPFRRGPAVDTVLVLVGLIALWQAGTLLLGAYVLPSPATTVAKLASIMSAPDFPAHAWETGRAFLTALVIALVGGLAIGLALGAHRLSGEVAEPILVAFYSIPKITLYPVILLLFGLGISAKIAFGVIHGIMPVAIFTMNAVRNVKGVYFRTARTMRLTKLQTAWSIVVPASIPEIVSGFRLGFALTLLGTLIGEMFASQRGLGYWLIKAMETNDVDTVMALALLLTALATAASAALLMLDRKLHRRLPTDNGA